MTGFAHTAVELFDAQFGPFMVPVEPGTKHPATYVEGVGRWRKVSSVTAYCASREMALAWDAAGASVGLRGGDGLLWIDNDYGIVFTRLIERAAHNLGVVSLRRFVDSPKHRRDAWLFRVPGKTKTLSLKFLDPLLGVEGDVALRGSGQQALITGIHPPTGARYLVSRKLTRIEDVPEVPASALNVAFQWIVEEAFKLGLQVIAGMPGSGSLVHAVPRALGLAGPSQTRGAQTGPNLGLAHDLLDLVELRQLLTWVSNDPAQWSKALANFLGVYQNWVAVCYAIIGATGGSSEGRDLWVWWSDQHAQGKVSSSDQWDACIHSAQTNGVRVGGTFLIELAQKYAWGAYHQAALQPFIDNPIDLPEDVRPIWDAFRAQWIVWSKGQSYINLMTSAVYGTRGFNMKCNSELPRLIFERYGPKPKRRFVKVSDFVDAQRDIEHVDGVTYHPGKPQRFCDAAGFDVFNEWRPPSFPRFPVSALDVKPWLDHLVYVLKVLNEAELLVRWLAFQVQFPDDKVNWAWLIMSLPGLGKDTLIEPMRVAFGDANVQAFDFMKLTNTHNYFVKSKLLVASEIAQHDNIREARKNFDHFKIYAARPPEMLTVNPKFQAPYQIPNRCGVVLFSNEFNPVAFDIGDRRVHAISCLDIKPRPDAYYHGLHNWFANQNGAVLIANYLEQLALSKADILGFKGPAPMTDVKRTLSLLNSDRVVHQLLLIVNDARAGGRFNSLVVTVEILMHLLSQGVGYGVSVRQVNAALYELAARGEVFPARPSPSEPDRPGKVSGKNGESERFWLLAGVHPQTGVDLRNLKGQELFDAFDLDATQRAAQFPSNVVHLHQKRKGAKKTFSTNPPDDPI